MRFEEKNLTLNHPPFFSTKPLKTWCGPRISAHALPLDGELDFYFENDFIH